MFVGCQQNTPLLPSGYVKIAIENGPVEIVDLPTKNSGFSIVMLVYQRVNPIKSH